MTLDLKTSCALLACYSAVTVSKMGKESYCAICCSSSSILARFDVFLGFGLGVRGGGVDSFCGFHWSLESPSIIHGLSS